MKTTIFGGTVLPLDGTKTALRNVDVCVNDKKIVAVGATGTAFREGEADKLIDARDKLVMPGLVNAHTHIGMTFIRGLADDVDLNGFFNRIVQPIGRLTPDDIYWATLLGIAEMLRSGTTTFADMFHDMDSVGRAVDKSGIRASLGSEIFSRYGGGREDVYEILETTLEVGVDFSLRWHGASDGRITTMLAPHATYTCSPTALSRVAQAAQETNQKICIHVSETEEQVLKSYDEYGRSPVAVLADTGILDRHVLGAHSIHLSDEDIELLSQADYHAVHCPQCNLKIALGVARLAHLMQNGINIALGTDSTASNNNLDMFEEVRLASLLHKWVQADPTFLPGEQVLQMATSGGARALGLQDLGTIEVGKKADIIILDTCGPHMHPENDVVSNVVYASSSRDVCTVMVDGKVVMEDYRILTFDESEAVREAERWKSVLESNH